MMPGCKWGSAAGAHPCRDHPMSADMSSSSFADDGDQQTGIQEAAVELGQESADQDILRHRRVVQTGVHTDRAGVGRGGGGR